MKTCIALTTIWVYILNTRHCVFGSDAEYDLPVADFPKTCEDVREYHNVTWSGVYTIYPVPNVPMAVYCYMSDKNQGWMVISRRNNGSSLFHRSWDEYMIGFGNLTEEMWLGNFNIHILTSRNNCTIRLQIITDNFIKSYIDFNYFTLCDDENKFIFYIGNKLRSEEYGYVIRVTADYELALADYEFAYRDISEEVSWWLTYLSITDMRKLYVKDSLIPEGYINWYELFIKANKITMMLRCGMSTELK